MHNKLVNAPRFLGWLMLPMIGLLFALSIIHSASAQEDELIWSEPLNLTQSGSIFSPQFVVDSNEEGQLLWRDPFNGFMMAQTINGRWQAPTAVRLPASAPFFASPEDQLQEGPFFFAPSLVAGQGELLLFWTDDESRFWTASVPNDQVTNQAAWTVPHTLDRSVVLVKGTATQDGTLHLTYIRTANSPQQPAGIYYRQRTAGNWSDPTLLYASNYLRIASDLNLQIVSNAQNVYVAWDDPAQERLYWAWSESNGQNWRPPELVDERLEDDSLQSAGPAQIEMIASPDGIHQTWHAAHGSANCAQYHRWSIDAGETWTEPMRVIDNPFECPTNGRLLYHDNLLFLLSDVVGETNIQAWSEGDWSEPDIQEVLPEFLHPQTQREVTTNCTYPYISGGRLFVVACSFEDDRLLDMWQLSRPLGTVEDWLARFSPTPVWSTPARITSSPFRLLDLQTAVDATGRIHATWSQSSDSIRIDTLSDPRAGDGSAIYYANFENNRWSSPRPILRAPDGVSDQPTIATDTQGQVFIVWRGGTLGELFFSSALSERAASVAEWTDPLPLPIPREGVASPSLAVADDGTLLLAYVVRLNEGRGVYVSRSVDNGRSWSEPHPVFVTNEWPVIDSPELVYANGLWHLTWQRYPTANTTFADLVLYAQSTDGVVWASPQTLLENPAIVDTQLLADEQGNLYQLWLDFSEARLSVWVADSSDEGVTWREPTRILNPSTRAGVANLAIDETGQVHVVQLAEGSNDQLLLQQWGQTEAGEWRIAVSYPLHDNARNAVQIAGVSEGNQLGAVYRTLLLNETVGELESSLFFTQRPLTLNSTPMPQATLTPTPLVLQTVELLPTEMPTATPIPFIPPEQTEETIWQQLVEIDPTGGLILGALPAVLLVGLTFLVGLWLMRRQ